MVMLLAIPLCKLLVDRTMSFLINNALILFLLLLKDDDHVRNVR